MMSPVNAASHQQLSYGAPSVANGAGVHRERTTAAAVADSPPATRAPRRTWKDPRLLVGVAIVAICVLSGARILATADDTVTVWAVRSDLSAGTAVAAGDLQREELRFGSPDLAGRYLAADDPLPETTVLSRDVTAGELLPRDALQTGEAAELVEVPIALPSDAVPATLSSGELVDVWVTATSQTVQAPRAVRVLEQVRVMDVPRNASALGPSSTQQVVVGLAAEQQGRLATALAELAGGTAVIVRRG
jgi:hypothetical protein